MKTRKLLAPYDLQNPSKKINSFLYPDIDSNQNNFFTDIKSQKKWEAGIVVFIQSDISKNDFFAKIVDSGKAIESVNVLLESLDNYFEQISSFKVGDVIGLQSLENGFELIKLKKPSRRKRHIP